MSAASDFAPVVTEFLNRLEKERVTSLLSHDYIEHRVEANEITRAQADRELVQLFQYETNLQLLKNFVSNNFREVQR